MPQKEEDHLSKNLFWLLPIHNWEGFRRNEYSESLLDLERYRELISDESHFGSEIIEE